MAALKAMLMVILAYISWQTVRVAQGEAEGLSVGFTAVTLVSPLLIVALLLLRLRKYRRTSES